MREILKKHSDRGSTRADLVVLKRVAARNRREETPPKGREYIRPHGGRQGGDHRCSIPQWLTLCKRKGGRGGVRVKKSGGVRLPHRKVNLPPEGSHEEAKVSSRARAFPLSEKRSPALKIGPYNESSAMRGGRSPKHGKGGNRHGGMKREIYPAKGGGISSPQQPRREGIQIHPSVLRRSPRKCRYEACFLVRKKDSKKRVTPFSLKKGGATRGLSGSQSPSGGRRKISQKIDNNLVYESWALSSKSKEPRCLIDGNQPKKKRTRSRRGFLQRSRKIA